MSIARRTRLHLDAFIRTVDHVPAPTIGHDDFWVMFMAILRVSRDSGYADYVRSYSVVLDGKEIGQLKTGESRDFQIPSGNHEIRLKIDWVGSKTLKFVADDDGAKAFHVSSNLRGWRLLLALWYAVFDTTSYLLLEPDNAESGTS